MLGPPRPSKSNTPPPGFILKAVREPVKSKVARRTSSGTARFGHSSGRCDSSGVGSASVQDIRERPESSAQASPFKRRQQDSSHSPTKRQLGERLREERRQRTSSRTSVRTSTKSPRGEGRPATSLGYEALSPSRGGSSPLRPGSRRRPTTTACDSAETADSQGPDLASTMQCGWSVCLASSRLNKKKAPKRCITMVRSVFAGRPPVLFFDYDHIKVQRQGNGRVLREEELDQEGFDSIPKMFFCHEKSKDIHEYNAVLNTTRNGGLYRTTTCSGKWSLHWGGHPSPELLRGFHPFQKANHFPASWHLGRKDLLWRNIHRMRRQFPQDFNIMPQGFILPDEFQAWLSMRDQNPSWLWIFKPANSSCGRGIRLLTSRSATLKIAEKTSGVIQRYVDNPLLLNGYKFDLRVYVVVSSYDPLRIYLNPEGLVRLATEKYAAPSSDNIDHRTMHLTNYSVNKHSESYIKNLDGKSGAAGTSKAGLKASAIDGAESGEDDCLDLEMDKLDMDLPTPQAAGTRAPEEGEEECEEAEEDGRSSPSHAQGSSAEASKWSFSQLREYCDKHGLDYQLMWSRMKDLIIKTIISAEPPIVNMWHQGANYSTSGANPGPQLGPHQTCFEIYGFDIMLDDHLKPWLLEVNIFPSLSSSSPFDKRVKTMLVADALTLAGIVPFDHDLVDKAVKEDNLKRLQGLCQRASPLVSRSHTVNSVSSAPLRDLGEAEWQLIVESYDEYMRRGSFEQVYPTFEATQRYASFFPTQRYSNLVLARWLHELGRDGVFESARSEMPPWVPRMLSFAAC